MSEGAEPSELEASEHSTASTMPEAEAREGYKWIQLGPKSIEIPERWEARRFGEVFEKRREKTTAEENETIRYVGLDDIESGNIHLQDYDENGADRSSTRGFREGDILFGKLRPYLNKAAVAPFDGVCSSDIIPIRATGESTQRFLLYLMHSKVMRDRAVATTSGTNLPRTSWGDLASAQFPSPSLPEQRRIAEVLSTVDKQIQQTELALEWTTELERGLMQDIFTGYVFSEELQEKRIGANVANIPTHWKVVSMCELCSKIVDGPHSTPKYVDNGVPFVSAGDIADNEIDFENCKRISEEADSDLRPRVDPAVDDILVGKVGSGSLGKICHVKTNQKFNIFVQLALLRPLTDKIRPFYLSTVLQYQYMQQQILDFASGASMQYIGTETIGKLDTPLPPIEEQKIIENLFFEIRNVLVKKRQTLISLRELKRGLMQDLLTGSVRVPESIEAED